jgi:predicted dehydrogenase
VEVLCGLVPSTVAISLHSRHNTKAIAAWANDREWAKRIELSSTWPQSFASGSSAAIVVNAARDHEAAVEWAIRARLPVLVEKPIALTFAGAQRLAELARDQDVRLAAAHVFLFAGYLENLSRLVADAGEVESLEIDWTDPEGETRYGERKRYDSSLPVFADWMPHVVSIAGALLPTLPEYCKSLRVGRGGAALDLELVAADVPCTVRLERNADRRRRVIRVRAGGADLHLDFSSEPGTITRGSSSFTGDRDWESGAHPVARTLAAFLRWAAGGELDHRLDIGTGLRACRIIDQVTGIYRLAVMAWLSSRLATAVSVDNDLRYALSEFLQSEGPLSATELDCRINRLTARFAGPERVRLSDELTRAKDPWGLLRSLSG